MFLKKGGLLGSGLGVTLLLAGLVLLAGSSQNAAQAAESQCQNFAETGFSICGRFLEYWQANGGLVQQGYPISQVFEEKNADPPAGDGKTHQVQYFQRARFEAHPENQPPYDVLLGLLGTEQYKAKYPKEPNQDAAFSSNDCQSFTETGYRLCGTFLTYWKTHGGLTQQGLPISPVFMEKNADPPAGDGKTYRVQYFQRARFEEHPENKPPYNVLLGLLGAEQFNAKLVAPAPVGPAGPGLPGPLPTPQPKPTLPASPPPANGPVSPAGCLPGFINIADAVQACVEPSNPAKNTLVTLSSRLILGGRVITGTQMQTSWKYPDHVGNCNAEAGGDGIARCSLDSGNAASGSTVTITVYFIYNSQIYNGSAVFTLQ